MPNLFRKKTIISPDLEIKLPNDFNKIGVSDKYCSECGEHLIEYTMPSNNPFRKFDPVTGRRIIVTWLICPNRKISFSKDFYDCLESGRHDARQIKPDGPNTKINREEGKHCAYCGNIIDGNECYGCGARVLVL